MSKQIMQQAFENMQKNERHTSYGETQYWCNQYKMFAVRLLTELAKPEQEPVAWHSHNPDYPIQDGDWVEVIFTSGQPDDAKKWTPLYTAPSKPEQEPVAWWNPITDNASTDPYYRKSKECIPLYTAPQKPDVTFISEGKTWQGLTDDEIELCREKAFSINNPYCPVDRKSMWKAAQYIQAKLREKNT